MVLFQGLVLSDLGSAAGMAPNRPVSREQLEKIRSSWISPKQEVLLTRSSTVLTVLNTFVVGLGNLLNIWPPRKERRVYMPETTVQQDIAEAWRDVGRDICSSSRTTDASYAQNKK